MIKVLFISQWYPHRYDLMAGLFVQKHAEAVSQFCEVKVLYIHADENIKSIEIENRQLQTHTEKIVYFPVNKKIKLYKLIKFFSYLKAYYIGYNQYINEGFIPEIVHANILTRTGFVAYVLNKWKNIPYVVTEHWSRYLPTRNTYKGFLRKLITKLVVKNASAILPVSKNLKNAMISHGLVNPNYHVVNNVVDNHFFKEIQLEKRTKKRIIHISCFDELAKNISGILRATLELSKLRNDFELIIIGTGIDFDKIHKYYKSLEFPEDLITFTGEQTPEQVSNWLKNSDLFVLFSNYETAGVVIAESLVCGKPVITTNVGLAPEYIDNNCGKIISIGNEKALLNEMNKMLDHISDYNNIEIKNKARENFSYENIGKKISEIYLKSIS